jgi:hypothetical protein
MYTVFAGKYHKSGKEEPVVSRTLIGLARVFHRSGQSFKEFARFLSSPYYAGDLKGAPKTIDFCEAVFGLLDELGEKERAEAMKYELFIKPKSMVELGMEPQQLLVDVVELREIIGTSALSDNDWLSVLASGTMSRGQVVYEWRLVDDVVQS